MVANHWSDDGMVTIHRSGLNSFHTILLKRLNGQWSTNCNECLVTFFQNYIYIFNKLTTASLQHLTNVWKVSERVNSPHIGLLYKLLKVRKDFNQVWGWAIVLKGFLFWRLPCNARLLLIALDVGLSSSCQYNQRPFNQFILSWQEEDQITKLEHIAKKLPKLVQNIRQSCISEYSIYLQSLLSKNWIA